MAYFLLWSGLYGADRGLYCSSTVSSLWLLDIYITSWPPAILLPFPRLHVLFDTHALYTEAGNIHCALALFRLRRDHCTSGQGRWRISRTGLLCRLYQPGCYLADPFFF